MVAGTYHVNGKGEVGKCSATRGKCPFGGADKHYASPEGAQRAYEEGMSKATVPEASRKTPPAMEEQTQEAVASGLLTTEEGSRVGSTVYKTDYMLVGRNQYDRRILAEVRFTHQRTGVWHHEIRIATIDKGERRMKVASPKLQSINPEHNQFPGGKLSPAQLTTLRGLGGWGPEAIDREAATDDETMHKLLKLSALLKG